MRTMNIGLMLSAFLVLQGISANAAQEIIVSAGVGMANAMTEIGKAFKQSDPSVKVTFNFASAGELLQQMAQGAPVDVFIPASQKFMDDAQAKQLIIPATRKDFTRNALALIAPAANASVTTLADLLKPEVKRVAIGDPASVPAGQYAKEAFEGEQMWEKLGENSCSAATCAKCLITSGAAKWTRASFFQPTPRLSRSARASS